MNNGKYEQTPQGESADEAETFSESPNFTDKLKAVIYGAAVGDALGVPYEGMQRDTFKCTGMIGEGSRRCLPGTFSDDTSLTLATCASIKEKGRIDLADMRERFCDWLFFGAYTPDGMAFGIGNATATALEQGRGCDHEFSNGNGSLMRIAPLAFTSTTDEQIEEVSAITHAHKISREACVIFVRMLRGLLDNGPCGLEQVLENRIPYDGTFGFLRDISSWPREQVRSTGYVLDTLGASLWCYQRTNSFEECVLTAVNLGDDSDTTACVAGVLAGAGYGYDSIPKEWVEQLRGKDLIDACLFS